MVVAGGGRLRRPTAAELDEIQGDKLAVLEELQAILEEGVARGEIPGAWAE